MARFFTDERRRTLGRLAVRAEVTIVVALLCALGFSLLVAAAIIWLRPIVGLLNALLVSGGGVLVLALLLLGAEMLWERLQRGRIEREHEHTQGADAHEPSPSIGTMLLGEAAGDGNAATAAPPLVAAVATSMLDRHARTAPVVTLFGLTAVAVAVAAIERRRTRHVDAPRAGNATKARQGRSA